MNRGAIEHSAGFWIRGVAASLDSVLLLFASWVLTTAILGAIYWVKRLSGDTEFEIETSILKVVDPVAMQSIVVGVYEILGALYVVILHRLRGATWGKVLLRVKVVDYATNGPLSLRQSVVRYFAQFFSALPFGAGYAMAAIHPEKRALHDLIAGTVSIRVDRPR